MESQASEERQRGAVERIAAVATVQTTRAAVRDADERCYALQVRPSLCLSFSLTFACRYLELSPEDVEVLLKTPRSASSASSGGSSSGLAEHSTEVMKLDPTGWAKWHIEMSERLKQRKAEAAAQLAKCV